MPEDISSIRFDNISAYLNSTFVKFLLDKILFTKYSIDLSNMFKFLFESGSSLLNFFSGDHVGPLRSLKIMIID